MSINIKLTASIISRHDHSIAYNDAHPIEGRAELYTVTGEDRLYSSLHLLGSDTSIARLPLFHLRDRSNEPRSEEVIMRLNSIALDGFANDRPLSMGKFVTEPDEVCPFGTQASRRLDGLRKAEVGSVRLYSEAVNDENGVSRNDSPAWR